MLSNAFDQLAKEATIAIRRFPLSFVLSLVATISTAADINWPFYIYASLLTGYFATVSLTLYSESHGWNPTRYYSAALALLALISAPFYLYQDLDIILKLLCPAAFLSVFIAPFWGKPSNATQIWLFQHQLFLRICFAFFASALLFLGLAAALGAVDLLFSLSLKNAYLPLGIVVTTLLGPLLTTAGIPTDYTKNEGECSRPVQGLLAYIIVPLLIIYAVILYCYAAKILLAWQLPKGNIAALVTGFSLVGMAIYFISYPLHHTKSVIGLFSRYFFMALPVPLMLLAIAIGKRVADYGVTEERYALLLFLFWLLLSCAIGLTKHSVNAQKYILTAAIFLLVCASFGPWGAIHVSQTSQAHRLEALLAKNNIWVDGKLQNGASSLDEKERLEIVAIAEYLTSTNKTPHLPWLADSLLRRPEANAETILAPLGIASPEEHNQLLPSPLSARMNILKTPYLDIRGYDLLVNLNAATMAQQPSIETQIVVLGDERGEINKQHPTFSYSMNVYENVITTYVTPDSTLYTVTINGDPLTFDLAPQLSHIKAIAATEMDAPVVVLRQESARYKVSLLLSGLDGEHKPASNTLKLHSAEGVLLIKAR